MLTSIWTRILDLCSPRTCPGCGHRLAPSENMMCWRCLLHLPQTQFFSHPEDNVMARRLWGRMKVERAAALCYYEPGTEVAQIIHQAKYYGRSDIAVGIGELMGKQMVEHNFFDGIDAIIPIPLAKNRQKSRGYNQSQLIAEGLNTTTRLPICDKVVERTEFSSSQTHLNSYERQENVAHSFRLSENIIASDWNYHGMDLRGKHLLVVDDVMTTGATIVACATQLEQIPEVKISVATVGFTK